MNGTLSCTLAAAIGIAGLGLTVLSAAANPQSHDALRAAVRADAMVRLQAGQIETVRHKKGHRPKYSTYRRWCGYKKYYGKRCYYTPWLLKPLRQR